MKWNVFLFQSLYLNWDMEASNHFIRYKAGVRNIFSHLHHNKFSLYFNFLFFVIVVFVVTVFIFNYLFVSLFILSGAGYCDGKADGNYRDPDNCYGYIACSNQIVYKMSCSSGLKYNEKLDQCDWPENVQCNPGKVHLLFSQRIFIISHCNVTKLSNWPL